VHALDSLTVSGNGSLTATGGTATGGKDRNDSYGVYVLVSITVEGGEAIAQSNVAAFKALPTIGGTFEASA